MAHSPGALVTQFSAALPTIPAQPSDTRGVLYRAVFLKHLTVPPSPRALFDRGPMRAPQRYSPPSRRGIWTPTVRRPVNVPPGVDLLPNSDYVIPGLYVAEHPGTAYLEANQSAFQRLRVGATRPHFPALCTLGLDVGLAPLDLLDLTQAEVHHSLGITSKDLLQVWKPINEPQTGGPGEWALTQILGFLAYCCGKFHGIRYPSARHRGQQCVLIFTERLVPGTHRLTVGDDPDELDARNPDDCCGHGFEVVP